ncbi:MAG: ribbon-helix-helix protein, CopG family [Deltaproteobacteria bacterium]|nr:ribbon-helix-helix protein, CopG family [Deltaproteobacteria bacterium]
MKLSISLPEDMAREIKGIATQSDRNVSWWIRQAWELARTQLLRGDKDQQAEQKALKTLAGLQGSLKKDYPHIDSVTLSHTAFQKKRA